MMQSGKPSSSKDEKEINPQIDEKQSDEEQSDEKLKALFVGQIDEEEYGERFKTLMGGLSTQYEAQSKQEQVGLVTCTNYDYYNDKHEYSGEEYPKILKGFRLPRKWVENMRGGCIEIANHALEVSGYGEYLTKKKKEFEDAGYNICCSVNYYYDRTGRVGMHQDSLGIELFVLLIYLDTVEGPEVKLKEESQFNERMDAISERNLMPEFFINEVQGLYQGVENDDEDLVSWDGASDQLIKELSKGLSERKVEWISLVEGPGGIVGFVDELMIHSTPLEGRRPSNSDLLLKILGEMKTGYTGKGKELEAIGFLETAIQKIKEEEHYISLDELQNIIDEQDEEIEKGKEILNELYKKMGEEIQVTFEVNALDLSEHTLYKPDYTTNDEDISSQYTRGRERRKSIVIQQQAKEGTDKGSEEEGTDKEPKKARRSFLRVWVTALPKKKD